jgi:Leucine-rich repeat (LRR) protein
MFIKRDLRKIDEILCDPAASKKVLRFANRKAEFAGSIRVLCKESKLPYLTELDTLNIYANDISNLQGIGLLSSTPIRDLNLGCNKIKMIPLEFGSLRSLRNLWIDDNELEAMPICIFQLHNLVSLRLSGNSIKEVPKAISSLQQLETLVRSINALLPPLLYSSQAYLYLYVRCLR